jgi:hypothetical protein
MFEPGSVKSGGTWQLAHRPRPLSLAALRGLGVEAAFWWRGCRDGELVEVEGSELRGDEVGRATHVAEAGGDRELERVVQARIVERPFPVHLQIRDEGVPAEISQMAG